jgi:DNA polymerase-4
MRTDRVILHVDLDAFFASVEQLDHPEYRGKPVLVGGSSRRGVVSTASYEARAFGCRSAMPVFKALQLCPQAIVVRVRGRRYREVSLQVRGILDRFSPLVEPLSVDEAFLDVTASRRLLGDGPTIARAIRKAVRSEIGITASVGVSFNKFLAKLGTDLNKPDGMTVITPDNLRETLDPLSPSRVWGIGPKAAERLARLNIRTIGRLRATPIDALSRVLGTDAQHVLDLVNGIDERDVRCDHDPKSVGQEQTFGQNIHDPDRLRAILLEQVADVAQSLRRKGLLARTVQLKLRYGDFRTITRRATLDASTDVTDELWHVARSLFDAWASQSLAPVRLMGFAVSGLTTARQAGLFDEPRHEKSRAVDDAVDRITRKFGSSAIRRAGELGADDER